MTIFGFAKYLALRLIQQPSVPGGSQPYASNAGNVFFALFAALGMVGAVGYGFNTVLRGPITSMTETTKRTVAESTVITSSRLAIVGATTQQTGAGDTDNDGFIEPVPYRDAGSAPRPVGGGYIPAALNMQNTLDPWNTEYGYCAWDHGSITASSRRLPGSPRNNRYAIAIISAGKDKRFQTSCVAYVDDTTELIQRTPGSDDIVLAYTYAEANDLGNGLWKPHATAPNTAMTNRNIDVTGRGIVAGGVVLSGNTATGGGLILPSDPGDDSISGACNAANDNQLRYNVSVPTEPPVIEICDDGGLGWSPVSGGAGSTTTGQLVAHYTFDETTGTTANDETGNHNGTLFNNPVWSPGQGRVGGALRFTAASNTYVRVPRTAALEPTAVTVSLWARRSGAQDTWAGLMAKTYGNNSAPIYHSYALYFNNISDDTISTHKGYTGGSHTVLSTMGFMQDSAWYHIVMVLNPAAAAPQERLYINGILANSDTDTSPIAYDTTNAGDLYIGGTQSASGEKFNGYIDDVRIYNYGMTDEEVMSLYSSVNPSSLNLDSPVKAGTIYGWGYDNNGKLGNGTDEGARQAPGPVLSTNRFIEVDSAPWHTCGVAVNGTVWCWGADTNGKLGNGGGVTADQETPYQVPGLTNMVKVTAGKEHTCALRNDGALFCWGLNADGELGDGTTISRDAPVPVASLANVVDISAGTSRTCAVVSGGGAWCWGLGTSGELGNGLTASSSVPVRVANINDFTQISVGSTTVDDPICGVTRTGKAYCWGADTNQQLGNGPGSTAQITPGEVTNMNRNFLKISVNNNTVCAIVANRNNSVVCWGAGSQGEMGNGALPASTNLPTSVLNISGIVDIAVHFSSVCALEKNGKVWCWGDDAQGRLGDGELSSSRKTIPVQAKIMNAVKINGPYAIVDTSVEASPAPPRYAKKFSAGNTHGCHIRSDGTLWCWGTEAAGELGNGGSLTDIAEQPVRVSDPGPWMSVSTDGDNSCAIKGDGSLWCWGSDSDGQLGNGAITGSQNSPSPITSAIPWTQVSVGGNYACGIKADGTAYCWGSDQFGKLGNDSNGSTDSPGTAIASTLPWIQISAAYTTCGIKSDNTLWCWGPNDEGFLGNGTCCTPSQTPVQVGTDTWRYIDAASPCGIKTDGSAWCWGSNPDNQLGVGSSYSTPAWAPRLVVEPGPWASISSANPATCGVKMDGTGWCWGNSDNGRLGIGTPAATLYIPTQIIGNDWAHIDRNSWFSTCGLKSDDSVWCWGQDTFAELGNGAGNSSSNYPQRIYQPYKSAFTSTDASTTTYAASPASSLAIGTTPLTSVEGSTDGLSFPGSGRSLLRKVTQPNQFLLETAPTGGAAQIWLDANNYPYYMGYNAYTGSLEFGYGRDWLTNYTASGLEVSNEGFVGIGTGGAPVAMLDVRGAVRPGQGSSMACGSAEAGTIQYVNGEHLYCDGGTWVPYGVTSVTTPFWDISMDVGGGSHACGIQASGSLWCWGGASNGRLGNGETSGNYTRPIRIGTATWIYLSTGSAHTCGIQTNGSLWCWGLADNGRLGNGVTSGTRSTPVQIGSATWKSVSATTEHTCGIQTNGSLWCWGYAFSGKLGNGVTGGNFSTPVQIGSATWKSVSAGVSQTCGIQTNGSLWCWGAATSGKLGNGTTSGDFSTPVQVGSDTWKIVSSGWRHACGIRTNGRLYCWGWGDRGRLGNGANGGSFSTPVSIGSATWGTVSAANDHSCGIQADGSLWCWGLADNGQLGNGTTTPDQLTPTSIGGTSWIQVRCGGHTCGTQADGSLWCWGAAANGRLGNGATTPDQLTPLRVGQ